MQALQDIPGVREVLVNKQMSTASVRYVQESDQNMKSVVALLTRIQVSPFDGSTTYNDQRDRSFGEREIQGKTC